MLGPVLVWGAGEGQRGAGAGVGCCCWGERGGGVYGEGGGCEGVAHALWGAHCGVGCVGVWVVGLVVFNGRVLFKVELG